MAVIKRVVAWGTRLWERASAWSLVAHVIRALERFNDRLGSQFAAAITYFSLLSLVPILMVAFSIAGFVLADRPDLVSGLKDQVTSLIPGSDLSTQIGSIIDHAVSARLTIGIIGLVVALYSGIGWMGNIRQALRAIWSPEWNRSKDRRDNIVLATAKDLGLLAGLGLAVAVSFGLSAVGNTAQSVVIRWLGLDDAAWITPLLTIATLLIAAVASLLIFLWMYGRLPPKEYRAPFRPLIIGSAIAALAFEVLKSLLTLLVRGVSGSASGAVFGSVIGLLFFINIVARVFLMIGSWIATDSHTPGGMVRVTHDVPADLSTAGPGDPSPVGARRTAGAARTTVAAGTPTSSVGRTATTPVPTDPTSPPTPEPASVAANPEHEAPVAAALGVGLITGWLLGRRSARRER